MRPLFDIAVFLLALVTVVGGTVSGTVQAAPLEIEEHQDVVAVGPYTEYLLDEEHELSLADVQSESAAFVTSTTQTLNFGFTQARIWIRFQINNPLDVPVTRILDVRHFLLDDITLYVPDGESGYQSIHNGRLNLKLQQHPLSRFFHYSLTFAPNSTNTYYLAIESAEAIGLPIMLSTIEAQRHYQLRDTLFMTLYGGLILATLFFALFMLVSLRERELLYYVGFLCSHHLIALMTMEGVPSAIFGFTHPYLIRETVPLFIAIAILFSVLFMRNFLNFKSTAPELYRVSHWMVGAMWLGVLSNFVVPHYYAMYTVSLVCMFVAACILVCCFIQVRTQPEARYFLFAWSAGILGGTIYGLKVFKFLPVNLFTNYSWLVGTMFEAILFSYTIAHRVNTERKKRLQTQIELAEQERALRLTQEQLLLAETAAKEELEARVSERTRDIARILTELEHENKELVELSINDGLTKVRNRRFFNDIYPQLWKEAQQEQRWLSVILMDIDHFKSINDKYGHLVGDHCLVAIASLLRKVVSRPGDVVCRYGGEEFVMLLPDTDAESAYQVGERIRRKISETPIETDDLVISMTASLGVAGIIPAWGQKPMNLISSCDEALYRSKQEGRNRVTLAENPQAPDEIAAVNLGKL